MKLQHVDSKILTLIFVMFIAMFPVPNMVMAHCDTMDGPVVSDANKAFETKNVNFALKWVNADNEAETKQAFELAMKVRPLSSDAKLLAEKYFYDLLIRIHRTTEGEPFTGVKPSGTPIDEKVREADKALETGNIAALEKLLPKDRIPELKERFEKAKALKNFDVNNVQAGREYIEAYVQFFKFAEGEGSHGHGTADEAGHALLLSFVILSAALFITTIVFATVYLRSRRQK